MKLLQQIFIVLIKFCKAVAHIAKTTTPKQRPRLFTAVWFFVCGLLAIEIYAIDPDMTVWDVMGYSLGASLIFGLLGAAFGTSILEMPKKELQLFKVAGLGALCGLFFTLIMVFVVPIYLLLSHALPMPNTQEAEQLLWVYGIIVPAAFVWLPAIIVGAITAVLLRLADYWFSAQPEEVQS
ncbi:MAG: hypothetical protein K0R66_1775 [Gammaproteobacteria bacterium]|jgi:hypothetical protein|nr:hypothetical protein [Gammaproteobacteria bacterium]